MSKVILFSRFFPAYHPRAWEPTYFVEKIWKSLWDQNKAYDIHLFQEPYDNLFHPMGKDSKNVHQFAGKHHTIREGNRFKAGEYFSPRVWSGTPYRSKQVIIADDIEIKKVWDIEIWQKDEDGLIEIRIDGDFYCEMGSENSKEIAINDGLSLEDFEGWFPGKELFTGQIICWNESINY